MRVKGRFVKRAVEQENKQQQHIQQQQKDEVEKKQIEAHKVSSTTSSAAPTDSSSGTSSTSSSRTNSPVPSAPPSGPLAPVQEDEDVDVDMPDVNDPEAGFQPTLSQPYRRTRRHTIT